MRHKVCYRAAGLYLELLCMFTDFHHTFIKLTHLLSKTVYKGMMPAALCSSRSTFIPENRFPLLYSDTSATAVKFLSVLKTFVSKLYQGLQLLFLNSRWPRISY